MGKKFLTFYVLVFLD